MAFPYPLIDSALHFEKVIPSNLSESPSSPLQIGDWVGKRIQKSFSLNFPNLPILLLNADCSRFLMWELVAFPSSLVDQVREWMDCCPSPFVFDSSHLPFLSVLRPSLQLVLVAMNQHRSLRCGAFLAQAGIINGWTSYPSASKSRHTCWNTNPPSIFVIPKTFSAMTNLGLISWIARSISPHR